MIEEQIKEIVSHLNNDVDNILNPKTMSENAQRTHVIITLAHYGYPHREIATGLKMKESDVKKIWNYHTAR